MRMLLNTHLKQLCITIKAPNNKNLLFLNVSQTIHLSFHLRRKATSAELLFEEHTELCFTPIGNTLHWVLLMAKKNINPNA